MKKLISTKRLQDLSTKDEEAQMRTLVVTKGRTGAPPPRRSVVSDSVRPHRRQPTRHPVPGTLQAGTLEWVAIAVSNA